MSKCVNQKSGHGTERMSRQKEFELLVLLGISFLSSFLHQQLVSTKITKYIMSAFPLHRLLQFSAVVAVFCFSSVHGFVLSPVRSRSLSNSPPLTARFVKQPTSLDEILPSPKKKNEIRVLNDENEDEEAYQRKMAVSFFLADSSLFGFVLLAVVALSGAVLNLSGYDYVIMPDGTLLIDTLEHFQMQYWIDAIPLAVTQAAI